ncbi:hypothetical protein BSKO_07875 [Bryopsis sp. KO-2023]|nr:hypothetical protein BSKO_07875 [Bryopsis sp. KO-2023]
MAQNRGLFPSFVGKSTKPVLARSGSFSRAAVFASLLLLVGLSGNVGTMQRRRLYQDMATHVQRDGLKLLEVGEGGKHNRFFQFKHGRLTPVLKRLSIPVRAVVIPLPDLKVTRLLETALRHRLGGIVPGELVWFQDTNIYHATIFHASSYEFPVVEDPGDVQKVQSVGSTICPLRVILEKIVVTSTGVIIACWQVAGGSEPATFRRSLKEVFEHAPSLKHQVIKSPWILHSTIARLVGTPPAESNSEARSKISALGTREKKKPETQHLDPTHIAHMADTLTSELCGLEMAIDNAWLVHEKDLLALALGGEYVKYDVPFLCKGAGR